MPVPLEEAMPSLPSAAVAATGSRSTAIAKGDSRVNLQRLFAAEVSDAGKLRMSEASRAEMDRYLGTLKGKLVEISVKEFRRTRSSQSNRYYWGVVVPIIAEHLGYTSDEMHEALKYKFLRLEAECAATDLPKIRSTATLDVKEFGTYLENVITWAGSEFGLNIPSPNEAAA